MTILLLQVAGWIMILLAAVHVIFPRYFNWKSELTSLSLINRQMMEVHTFFVAFVVFLMGILTAFCAADLAGTRLGAKLCLGLAVFWFARLVVQFFWYSPALWKGKPFETIVHIGFSILWLLLTTLFGWTGIHGW